MVSAVVAAVVAGIGAAGTASLAAAGITGFAASALIGGASALVLGGLSRAIAKKPKAGGLSNNIEGKGITRQVRQPITTRNIIYGEMRTSGAIVRLEESGSNKFLHMVLAIADGEIEEIGEIWLDDYPITDDMLDGSNIVNTGRYDGLVRINKHLGDQVTADADLVSETSATSTDIANGVAYIYIRLEFNRDVFPNGVPNVSAWVKGLKILDTRDSVTRYTPNIALMVHDYLLDTRYGFEALPAEIDDAFTDAAANICEEIVTTTNKDFTPTAVDATADIITIDDNLLFLQTADQVELLGTPPAGLATSTNYYVIVHQRKDNPRIQLAETLDNAIARIAKDITSEVTTFTVRKNGEPRYFGGGFLDTATEPQANIEEVLTGMAGRAIYSGGTWQLLAGAYNAPSVTLDESHFVSGISVQTKVSRSQRFNTVKGTYVSPINNGQPTDYPSVTNSTYVTQDNGVEILRDLDLPFTQRPHTSQRIAKIELERMRQEIAFTSDFNLNALQLKCGDTVNIDNTRFGWSNKIFEVTDWKINIQSMTINMSLRETATTVYDWNNGEETAVDSAPDSNLPDPFTVGAPTGLTSTPIEIPTASGDPTYKFKLSWTASTDLFVQNGGQYEVQFKQTGETDWGTSFPANDEDVTIDVNQVRPGVNYDARVRAVNNVGVRSSYNSLFGFTVSSPSGATIALDYLTITGTETDFFEYGNITDAVDGTNDFGSLT